MRKLELTSQHKTKLEEMIAGLYGLDTPNRQEKAKGIIAHSSDEHKPDTCFMWWSNNKIKFWFKKFKSARFIHWYEFCLTFVSEKLFFHEGLSRGTMDEYLKFTQTIMLYHLKTEGDASLHPVDYLYDVYQKVKKG